ncbi:GIY-YIG nuclease family protein [Neisseriaceae bacterium B1]
MNWCVYLVLCDDGSLYCGITNQPAARFAKHQSGKGARYTKMRGAVEMRVIACCLTRAEALRGEYSVKAMKLPQKRYLWNSGQSVDLVD